jgi:hypothetical protein
MQQHTQSILHGLVAEQAGRLQLVVYAGIKINFGHGLSFLFVASNAVN